MNLWHRKLPADHYLIFDVPLLRIGIDLNRNFMLLYGNGFVHTVSVAAGATLFMGILSGVAGFWATKQMLSWFCRIRCFPAGGTGGPISFYLWMRDLATVLLSLYGGVPGGVLTGR
jgi:hypothetical protein